MRAKTNISKTKQSANKVASEQGFTIIEVLLFLAISAGLIVALLATVGTSISRQRFTDSVASVQAFMQQQVNLATTVTNDRDTGSCDSAIGGATSTGVGTATSGRGASDCVILGRAVDFGDDARVTIHNIVGKEPTADEAATATGAELLKLYRPGIDTQTVSTYDIPWDARPIGITPEGVRRIILLRSPDSGTVLTFGGAQGAAISEALTDANRTYNVCIKSAEGFGAVAVIRILPVSGNEAIQTKSNITGAERTNLCGEV